MTCGCNHWIIEVSGGIEVGGQATVTDSIIRGGVEIGGSALVDVSPDPWDGMEAVWPLDELGSGTANEYEDKTRHNLHGTGGGGNASFTPAQDNGVFCRPCQSFDGADDWIDIPKDGLIPTQGWTVSLWTRLDDLFTERAWFTRGIETPEGDKWVLTVGHTYINHVWARLQLVGDESDLEYWAFSTTTLAADKWYHVAASWTPGDKLRVHLNGTEEGDIDTPELEAVAYTNAGYMGRWNEAAFLTGDLMDVRLHPVPRDEDWLTAEHDNYCSSSFLIIGSTVSFR